MEPTTVRDLLQKLQDGYTKRDEAELDTTMELFCQSDELEVIGTNAVAPGQGEWCRGIEATRTLIRNDWSEWGRGVAGHNCHGHDVAP